MTKPFLPFPVAALYQHIVALGKTRSGKSSKVRVIVEYLLDMHHPVCIIDPKGDWWGLKADADGKRAGYPVIIFGGPHADVPLNPRAGAAVAELIATGNRPSIIDLKGWMPGDRTRFFIDFASKLFQTTQGQRFLVIDEVHNFAPKGKVLSPEAGTMLHWANRLATEAQGMGLTLLLASQRPQKVHNDVLTSCETLIACRVIHKADRDAIKDWIDGCADPALGKQVLGELAQMKRSEAWVWSPEAEFGPEKISWPMFRTYDSFKPQQSHAAKLKGWAEVDLDEVKAKLSAVVEEARANDPDELRKEIAALKKQLQQGVVVPDLMPQIRAAEATAFAKGAEQGGRAERKWFADQLKLMRKAAHEAIEEALTPKAEYEAHPIKSVEADKPWATSKFPIDRVTKLNNHNVSVDKLPTGEATLLRAAIQYPDGVTREQMTLFCGYKRSSRDEYLRRLVLKNLIEIQGDLIQATDAGRAIMPDAEPLPTGEALQAFWRGKLPEGERKILDVLIEQWPQVVSRDDLDEPTGYKRSSRNEYLRRLANRQLITTRGADGVRASELLF